MNTIQLDLQPRHALSPRLYMQFMEPLGVTDGSVEAAWQHGENVWRSDVIEITRDLAPTVLRWGGCFSSYYRWKEAVGPRNRRRAMHNLLWGGLESGQIGTREFVDFCAQVEAEPLMCVNFESDGRQNWAHPPHGGVRAAGPNEAAQWVDYCNNPDNALRKSHGIDTTHDIKMWQIGNETSYDAHGFDCETAARKTVQFARKMRAADAEIELIGWGDSGWAGRMSEVAGEHLDALAFHHMFHPAPHTDALDGINYRRDWDETWALLMNAHTIHERKIQQIQDDARGSNLPLMMTECHFTFNGRNRGDLMATWAVGVAYARMLNVHLRHGDRLKMATLADFCGTRWQVNALMIPTPSGQSFLMPVGHVMRLYRRHSGEQFLQVLAAPDGLDICATRTENTVFLHVVNISRTQAVKVDLSQSGLTIRSGKIYEIAAAAETEILQNAPDVVQAVEKSLPESQQWTFPAASVSVVELKCAFL